MNILLIEDEKKLAEEPREMLQAIGDDIFVGGVISSVRSAIRWLQANPEPDLIISDIQLSDGLSFEIFSRLIVSCPVIFVTAFDQYAIRAFESNGIEYLLKPVDREKLKKAITRFRVLRNHFTSRPGSLDERLVGFSTRMSLEYKRSILVRQGDKILPVGTAELEYIFASNGLVTLRTAASEYYTEYTMEQLESFLDPLEFYRANRQYIVNRRIISTVEHYFNRRLYVRLSRPTPEKIIVSKDKAAEFLSWLGR